MFPIVNIVWAAGSEGYHLKRAMENFSEPQVLNELARQVQAAGMTDNYIDAMRRSVEIVEYHRHVQNGATIAKNTHEHLQATQRKEYKPSIFGGAAPAR